MTYVLEIIMRRARVRATNICTSDGVITGRLSVQQKLHADRMDYLHSVEGKPYFFKQSGALKFAKAFFLHSCIMKYFPSNPVWFRREADSV